MKASTLIGAVGADRLGDDRRQRGFRFRHGVAAFAFARRRAT